MGVIQIGRYELRSTIARSPGSTVHEAWDSLLSRSVAIKIIPVADKDDPETREALLRFAQGARAAGGLNHPNIVAVHDYGETDACAFLVMELVDGVTLKALLERRGRMTPQEALPIVEDVLAGLSHSHGHGIVHRDIKPANIMILDETRAKVTDFGVARIEANHITQTGTIIGTPAYMSPEQFRGEQVDLRTDIYSTGVVLYQMLTGSRPYEGSVATIAHKVLHTNAPPPSQVAAGLGPALDAVVCRAMAKERGERFASAADFARALRTAIGKQAGDVTLLADEGRASLRADFRPGRGARDRFGVRAKLIPVAAGVILALAVGGVFLLARHQPARRDAAAVLEPPAKMAAAVPTPPTRLAGADTPPRPAAPAEIVPKVAPVPAEPARQPGPAPAAEPSTPARTPQPPKSMGDDLAARAQRLAMSQRPVAVPPPLPAPRVRAPVVRPDRSAPPVAMPVPLPPRPDDRTVVQPPPAVEAKAASPAVRPRVFIYYPSGSSDALQMTADLAARMLFSDFSYADTRSAANVPSSAEIRYFHPEDAESAGHLAALLSDAGPEFQVREITGRAATEPPGVLQVWLAR